MLPAYAVLLMGLLATWYEARRVEHGIEQQVSQRFQESLRANRDTLIAAFLQYLDATRSANSFIRNNQTPDQEGWDNFMHSQELTRRIPAFSAIGYAELVKTGTKWSLPVRFVQRFGEKTAFSPGYDLASDTRLNDAALHAVDPGPIMSTPELDFTNATGVSARVAVLFIPRYEIPSNQKATAAVKQQALRGFAFATYDSKDLWADLLKKIEHSPVAVTLSDAISPETLTSKELRKEISIGTWGRSWKIIATPRPSFVDSASSRTPSLVLLVGLSCTLLAFVVMGSQVRHRIQAESTEAQLRTANENLEQRIAERTTQLRTANEQLENSLAKEKELGEMKSNFVSTVSHEFRTPLGIIVSSAGILESYLERLSAQQREEHLTNIRTSADRMVELMESSLLLSRVESSAVEFDPQPLDLQMLCRRVIDEIKSSTNARCLIEVSFAEGLDSARADEKLLRTILTNILTNAVKYSSAGSLVRLFLLRDGQNAVFKVVDAGIGISKVDLPKLFAPFFRGQNATAFSGTGLGLVIVKRCVEIHGGQLHVDSDEGKGTTVTVQLPLFKKKN